MLIVLQPRVCFSVEPDTLAVLVANVACNIQRSNLIAQLHVHLSGFWHGNTATGKQQEEEARSIRSNQRARRHTERQPELIAKVIQPSLDEETSSPAPPHCPRPVASGTAVAREPEAQPGAESEDARLPRRRARSLCGADSIGTSWRTGQFGTAKLVDFGEGRSVNSAGPLYRQV